MAETKKIKTALVSVFHKDGLDELLKELNNQGVKFLSTGGTQSFIESVVRTRATRSRWQSMRFQRLIS